MITSNMRINFKVADLCRFFFSISRYYVFRELGIFSARDLPGSLGHTVCRLLSSSLHSDKSTTEFT